MLTTPIPLATARGRISSSVLAGTASLVHEKSSDPVPAAGHGVAETRQMSLRVTQSVEPGGNPNHLGLDALP